MSDDPRDRWANVYSTHDRTMGFALDESDSQLWTRLLGEVKNLPPEWRRPIFVRVFDRAGRFDAYVMARSSRSSSPLLEVYAYGATAADTIRSLTAAVRTHHSR